MSRSITTFNKYCQVGGCRFPHSHLTKAHQCGTCYNFGHGQKECGNSTKISKLKHQSRGIRFPSHQYCQAPACRQSYSHHSDAHICSKCKGRHFEISCPSNMTNTSQTYVDPTSEAYAITEGQKVLGSVDGYIFGKVYAGQGCDWYVKRDSVYSPIRVFFMHGDNWGQYGPLANHTPKLIAFLNGYRHVSTRKFFSL